MRSRGLATPQGQVLACTIGARPRGPSRSSTACAWRSKPARQLGSCGSAHSSCCTPIRISLAAARRTRHDQRHGRHQDGGQQARRPHRRPAATLPKGGRRATHDRGRACDCRCADRFRRDDLDRARSGRTAAHRHRAHPQAPTTPTRPLSPDRHPGCGPLWVGQRTLRHRGARPFAAPASDTGSTQIVQSATLEEGESVSRDPD